MALELLFNRNSKILADVLPYHSVNVKKINEKNSKCDRISVNPYLVLCFIDKGNKGS